jgi:hypothetical protein
MHHGISAFLNLFSGLIILVHYPKVISYGHLYIDNFGQLPNPKNLDWSQYTINRKHQH